MPNQVEKQRMYIITNRYAYNIVRGQNAGISSMREQNKPVLIRKIQVQNRIEVLLISNQILSRCRVSSLISQSILTQETP